MKRSFYRHLALLLLISFTQFTSSAQNITGIWRGYFITESSDQYKYELQIYQNGNSISGVSYSYLSTVFYGKATLTGNFNNTGQSTLIREIKTVELKMDQGSSACIMKCLLSYERSGKEEFLDGTFTSKFEKDGLLTQKGGDCGGGKVHLRKVTTSDFYIEPFLRGKIKTIPVIINEAPLKKDLTKAKPTTTPAKKPVVVVTKFTNKNNPVTKTNTAPVKKPTAETKPPVTTPITKTNIPPAIKPTVDSIQKNKLSTVKIAEPTIAIPDVLKNRTNELVKVLIVNDPEIVVKLYDNGEIDGDTISVYLDKKLVLASKGLTATPLIIKFKIEEDNSEHELIMVAENMGLIPPNTALMIVEAGEQRFDVHITSTDQQNAVVRFKYKKPK